MLLHEFTGASKDFGYEQQHREHRNDLNSIGFNASWDIAENFNLGFDFHNSRAGSHPDDGHHGRQPDVVLPRGQGSEHRKLRAW